MGDKRKIAEEISLAEYVNDYGLNIGFKIPPGSYVKVIGFKHEDGQEDARYDSMNFHLTRVCLGPDAAPDERAILTFVDLNGERERELVCSSLKLGMTENDIIDLIAEGDFLLGNPNTRATAIHVLGRMIEPEEGGQEEGEYDDDDDHYVEEEDDDDEEYDDEYDDDEHYVEDDDDEDDDEGMFIEMDDDDDDMDDDNDDDLDDDDDGVTHNSTVTIEQLPSDDEDNDEIEKDEKATNGAKRQKLEDAKMSSDKISSETKPADAKKPESKNKKHDDAKKAEAKKEDSKGSGKKEEAKSSEKKESFKKEDSKTLEKKAAESKPNVAKNDKESKTGGESPSASVILSYIKELLKTMKQVSGSDLGAAISKKFGKPFKQLGFEEKTLVKFVEVHAKGEIVVDNEKNVFKLK